MSQNTDAAFWLEETRYLPASPEQRTALHGKLVACYCEPLRAYHNLTHINALLTDFNQFREHFHDPVSVYLAIWFHDAVYKPGSKDNEERSARMAEAELPILGASDDLCKRVAALVRATAHHLIDTSDEDGCVFMDLDMAILGAEAQQYEDYTRALASEYARIPGFLYRRGRKKFLKQLLKRDIYQHPLGRSRWDAGARANIARELKTL